jgi:hypothetical protein
MRRTLRSPPVDVSQVAPNLFIGSRPPPGYYRWLGVIVLCAREYQPPVWAFPNVTIVRAPLDDDPRRPMTDLEITTAVTNAGTVARYLIAGHRVLTSCHMGLNRSSLIAGLAMQRVFGMTADEVVERVREYRHPHALGNPRFVELLQRADRRA